MRNIILITLVILSFCTILITYSRPDAEDELAYRMSRSESFINVMNYGKQIANGFIKMPDSTKNNLKAYKIKIDSIQQNENLTLVQKSELIIKIVKSSSILQNQQFTFMIKNAIPYNKKFMEEFPELKKFSKEERRIVLKKATALLLKNQKYK